MSENNIQVQIDAINSKLDIVLTEIHAQKQVRESASDLMDDLKIVGYDVFNTTVAELDKAGVEIDQEAVAGIGIRFLRNLSNLNQMLETMESANDFLLDAVPIIRQVGLDTINKANELDQKGYFEFFGEFSNVIDNIVTHFSKEDIKALSENIVTILETVKSITQPDMLVALNNGIHVFKNLDTENVSEYSLWKAFKEMRSPEMRKGIGLIITFLKNMAKEETK